MCSLADFAGGGWERGEVELLGWKREGNCFLGNVCGDLKNCEQVNMMKMFSRIECKRGVDNL